MEIECNAIVWRSKDRYLSICPELGISSCGESAREAVENLVTAMKLYFEGEDACVLHVAVQDDDDYGEFDIQDEDTNGILPC